MFFLPIICSRSYIIDPPLPSPEEKDAPEINQESGQEEDCLLEEVGYTLVEPEPIVKREKWGAMKPQKPPELREGRPSKVVVVDTATGQCKTKEECSRVLRNLQEMLVYQDGEDDLPYNFMIGGDGRVYEGRGFGAKLLLPSVYPDDYEDERSFIIAFIGDFSEDLLPPEKMVKARREFVLLGKDIGFFDKKIEIWTQLQWKI